MKRVLVGSCGGLTGVYLLKQLRKYDDFVLFGADADKRSMGRFFCEKLYNLPPANNNKFIDNLISLLNNEEIDIYLPTHSKEMRIVSEYENVIRSKCKTKFIVSPFETFKALDNKLTAYNSIKKIGLSAPHIIENESDIEKFPIFAKKKMGSGSSGIVIINDIEGYEAVKKNDDYIVVEYLNGPEYTVDCLFSDKGNLLGYNQRKRNKCIGGAVSVSENDNSIDIFPYLKLFMKNWTFRGCVNFQYIVCDGQPVFIDINLRYASGGLPLSVKSGMDIFKALRKLFLGEQFIEGEFYSDFKKRIMYRYFEEVYEE